MYDNYHYEIHYFAILITVIYSRTECRAACIRLSKEILYKDVALYMLIMAIYLIDTLILLYLICELLENAAESTNSVTKLNIFCFQISVLEDVGIRELI